MRRRLLLFGAGLGLVAVLGAVVVLTSWDRARPVDEGDVTGGGLVYAYATTGFETITALGGARHDYPADSYLTITEGGCGRIERWQALRERWDEEEWCTGGLFPVARREYHEWFRNPDLGELTCELRDGTPSPEAGSVWTVRCVKAGSENLAGTSEEVVVVRSLGVERLEVGGETVEVVHLESRTEGTGETSGSSGEEEWRRVGDGLLVRRVATSATTTRTRIGEVDYTEEYEIVLRSLDPLP